jgi:hypothetical protein
MEISRFLYEILPSFLCLFSREGRETRGGNAIDSDQAYQIKFLNIVQVIDQCGASLGEYPLTHTMLCKQLGFSTNTATATATATATEVAEISKKVRDYTLGSAIILGADLERYSSMIRCLKNSSLAG